MMHLNRARLSGAAVVFAASLATRTLAAQQAAAGEWPAYGGDPGGQRYSPLAQVTRQNVGSLKLVWAAHTGDLSHPKGNEGDATGCGRCHKGTTRFEVTPLETGGRLLLSTAFNRALALDPATGKELWRFDPKLALNIDRNEGYTSRGVAHWKDARGAGGACSERVMLATVDARLFALDAANGKPCADFGQGGFVRLDVGVGSVQVGQYGVTSPPVVVGNTVVVGSAIGDNRRVELEHGTVRAYDARTGALLWAWDPIPRSAGQPGYDTWTPEGARKTGAANAWAPLSVDSVRGLVFVPTGSASPDFFGGERKGANLFANSVVALEVATGKVRWHFQAIHHDLWDYDVVTQPTLTDVVLGGRRVAAVIAASKNGNLFILDRDTGKPLFPVEERPVPRSTIAGEEAWPTQPYPVKPRPLHPNAPVAASDLWGATPADLKACQAEFSRFRNEGAFTPPSLEGTLMFPGYAGGVNWGGVSVDPVRQLLVVNSLRLPAWVKLRARKPGETGGNQAGTPYIMDRAIWSGPSGLPCVKGPWGLLTAIDLRTGDVKWEVPLGAVPKAPPQSDLAKWGSPNFGGSLVTAGGLAFISAAMDEFLRAFDVETGRELWKVKLPAGGQATPMTYSIGGRQYIAIAAGGHGNLGTTLGDQVVVFALPGEPPR
jgi:quinoprotein glucose dehydrogenase